MTQIHNAAAPPHLREETERRMPGNEGAFAESDLFIRANWLRLLLISVVVLIPCFWHRRIEAGDLASHVYNAWLAQLIERGQVHGLWIAQQYTNVLFDLLLNGLANIFGIFAAEKIAVSLAVLIFFWGTFSFVAAAARRSPWFLVPLIAVIAYGWTFELGFFNYYISIGLSFAGLAILWRGKGRQRLFILALVPLILLAHPLGLAWLVAAGVYIAIAENVRHRYQLLLLLGAVGLLFLIHFYLWHHYIVQAQVDPFYRFNGTDQLLLYGSRYDFPSLAWLFFTVAAIVLDFFRRRREPGSLSGYWIPLELYAIVMVAALLLPDGIHIPDHPAALALLTPRLSSVSAVLLCCLLGAMRPRRWHLIGAVLIAAIFFTYLYQDTLVVNRMEHQAEKLVRTLPPNQRVMATIKLIGNSRVLIQHIADRACIGYCFSYGNYEPSTGEFRVRALRGNPYVLTDGDLTASMEEGTYTVQEEDLPVYQVYQCSISGTELCIRPLEADEDNDRLGVHPPE